jgi:hypothetical protein
LQLSELKAKERDELADVYRRNPLGGSKSFVATNAVKMKFDTERHKVVREKEAIEERLRDVKNRRHSKARAFDEMNPQPDVAVLLRIEKLLRQLVDNSQKDS